MLQSKLFESLRCFGPKHLNQLRKIILSPVFNKDEDLIKLFDYLLPFAPRFSNRKLSKEAVYKKAMNVSEFDEKRMGYLMSNMLKMIDQLVVQQGLKKQPQVINQMLMNGYLDLNLEKNYTSALKEARAAQKNSSYRDAEFYFNEFQLQAMNNAYFDKQRKHTFDESLQKAIDSLDLYYLSVKLKYSCEIANRKNVLTADYELRLLDEILIYLKQNPYDHVPAIAIYFKILMTLLESENESHFDDLKSLLSKNIYKFPVKEARDMYRYAQNYCIKKINRGEPKFLKELFSLYKTGIENEILIEGKYLSPWTFKNIAVVALRIEEFDWTENFIHEYRERLSPKFRENAFHLNLTLFHFYKNNYGEALSLLQKVAFTDIVYVLETKTLMLRIYYELNEIEALHSLIDSFKALLRRNKLISAFRRNVHLNLLKYVKKLSRIRNGDKTKLAELKSKISEEKQVASIDWLLKKVDEKFKK